MTSEKQRAAIASYCGWKFDKDRLNPWISPDGLTGWISPPPYDKDLNQMHKAEKVLDDGVLWGGYLNNLWHVVCPQFQQMSGLNAAIGLLLVHATAAQRAEAFLKTIGKWEE